MQFTRNVSLFNLTNNVYARFLNRQNLVESEVILTNLENLAKLRLEPLYEAKARFKIVNAYINPSILYNSISQPHNNGLAVDLLTRETPLLDSLGFKYTFENWTCIYGGNLKLVHLEI
jgi:hypothetical protein